MSYMGMDSGSWIATLPADHHAYLSGANKMAHGLRASPSTSPIVAPSSRLSLTPLKKLWHKPREDGNEVGDMGQAQNISAGQHWQSALLASSSIPSRTNSATDIGRARHPYSGSPKPMMGSHPVATPKRPVAAYNISGPFPVVSQYSATPSPPSIHSFPVINTHPLANSHPINTTYSATSSNSGIGSFPATSSYPATNGYRASTSYPVATTQLTERSTSLMKSQPISKNELKTSETWTTSSPSPSPSSTPVVPVISTWTKTKVTSARPEVSVYRPKQDTRFRSRLPSQETLGGPSSPTGTSMSVDSPLTSASLSMTSSPLNSSNLSPMTSANLSSLHGVPCGLPNPLARSFPIVGYVSDDGEMSPDYDAKYHPLSSIPQEDSPPTRQRSRHATETDVRSNSAYRRDESPYLRDGSATPSVATATVDSALQANLVPHLQTSVVKDGERGVDEDQRPSSRRNSVCSNASDNEFREHLSNIYGFGGSSITPSVAVVVPVPVSVPAAVPVSTAVHVSVPTVVPVAVPASAPVSAATKIMTKEIPMVITEITEITDDTPIDLDILKARKDQCMLRRNHFEQRGLPPTPPPTAAALATTYSCSRTQPYNCPRTRQMIRSSFSSEGLFDEMIKNGFQSMDLTLSTPLTAFSSCSSTESLSEPWTDILHGLEDQEEISSPSKTGIRYITLRLTLTPWHARAEETALYCSDPVLLPPAVPRTKRRSRARRSVTSSASFLSTKATKLLARSSSTPISNTVHPLVTSMLQSSFGSLHASSSSTNPCSSNLRRQRSISDPRAKSPMVPSASDELRASIAGFPVVCYTPPEPSRPATHYEKIFGLEKPRSKEIKIKDRKKVKVSSGKIQAPPPASPLPPPPPSPPSTTAPSLPDGHPESHAAPRQGSSSPTLLAMAAVAAAGDALPRRPSPPTTLTRAGSDVVLTTRMGPVLLGASPLVRQRTISAPLQPIAKVLDSTSSPTSAISDL